MQVEQIMTRNIQTCAPSDTLNRATQLMWEHDCGCIPVVDSENKLVGVITDRDIAMAAYIQGKRLAEIRVGDVMAQHVHTCFQDDDLSIAQTRMRKHQVRRLPVTDSDGTLVGLLSLNDLALEALRERGPGRNPLRLFDVAETLANICRHRDGESLGMAAE
jgi:CBS domain-containing protein